MTESSAPSIPRARAGEQQLAYHLWTQSTPGRLGREELKRAFSALLAEVSRRGELILESATPARRRMLFATANLEDEETSTDSFIRFAGFKNNSSVGAAPRPFLKGNNAILEKARQPGALPRTFHATVGAIAGGEYSKLVSRRPTLHRRQRAGLAAAVSVKCPEIIRSG